MPVSISADPDCFSRKKCQTKTRSEIKHNSNMPDNDQKFPESAQKTPNNKKITFLN